MRFSRSQLNIIPILLIGDALATAGALYLAFNLRFFSFVTDIIPATKGLPAWKSYTYALYFILPLWIFIFVKNGMYREYFVSFFDNLIRTARSVTLGILFLVLTTFFYRDFSYSRLTFVLFWLFATVLITGYREIFKFSVRFILRWFVQRPTIVVVGKENKLLRHIVKKHPHLQVLYFPYDGDEHFDKLRELARERDVEEILMVQQKWDEHKLMSFYDWCENQGISLKFLPDILQLCKGEVGIDSSLGIPIFHLRPISLGGFNFYFKRLLDVIGATVILSLLWPLLFFTAVLIMLDSQGTILYHHKRVGYRGNIFPFYKFRTMVKEADVLLEKFKKMSDRKGPVFKMSNDPRITRIGKFLRRFSIDEIPQLINVLRGEMSLVGPRPQVLWEAKAYDDWARRRLRVLPGITGLWQISGRASLSYEEMIELDIFYIENWSLGLDIKILLGTLPAVFSKRGAY